MIEQWLNWPERGKKIDTQAQAEDRRAQIQARLDRAKAYGSLSIFTAEACPEWEEIEYLLAELSRLSRVEQALREIPRQVELHLSCLPANLREIVRGLKNGFFGPPVPIEHRGPETQRWVNSAIALTTTEDAIAAVEWLQKLVALSASPEAQPEEKR